MVLDSGLFCLWRGSPQQAGLSAHSQGTSRPSVPTHPCSLWNSSPPVKRCTRTWGSSQQLHVPEAESSWGRDVSLSHPGSWWVARGHASQRPCERWTGCWALKHKPCLLCCEFPWMTCLISVGGLHCSNCSTGIILFCPQTGIGEGDIQDISTGQSKIFLLLCKSRVLGGGIMEQLRAMSLELKTNKHTPGSWMLCGVGRVTSPL